jgi:hypothetical protein
MTGDQVGAVAGRLSLRGPQRRSIENLARVCVLDPASQDADAGQALPDDSGGARVGYGFRAELDFACFALATGSARPGSWEPSSPGCTRKEHPALLRPRGQLVCHLRSYLNEDEYHQAHLADLVHVTRRQAGGPRLRYRVD